MAGDLLFYGLAGNARDRGTDMQKPELTPGFDWDDGRLFLAVARAGQMFAASVALGINQATLSRRMAELERPLGTKPLVRRTHCREQPHAGAALAETMARV